MSAAGNTDTTRTGESGIGELFSADSLTYSVGPAFVWPFLNYGRIRNDIRVQDARLQQALIAYREAVLQAAREVEDSMIAFTKSREQDEILAAAVDVARRSSDLSLLRYREGFADYQRVLDSQQALFNSQQRYAVNRGAVFSNYVAVFRSLGGGWQSTAPREYVATDDFLEGFYDPEALAMHPLNYALGIANAASEAGVRIFENSKVVGYSKTDPALVCTAKGSVKASHIVLACNGYLGKLEPRSAGKIMPINNFMVATEPLGQERALEMINGRFGVHDTRFVVNYFRLSEDYRLLYGGGENYRPGFPRDIENFVRPYMLRMFPQLSDVKIDYAWGGTLAVTVNRLPHIGRLEPNAWFGQGYSGHGISTATFAGMVIAEAIAGTAGRFDAMTSLPTYTFPGGTLLRYPGMVLGMLYYGLKDRF